MWTRLVAKLMALVGLYALVLAGVGMRFSGQKNAGNFSLTMVELGIVTTVFLVVAVVMIARRARRPGEPLE